MASVLARRALSCASSRLPRCGRLLCGTAVRDGEATANGSRLLFGAAFGAAAAGLAGSALRDRTVSAETSAAALEKRVGALEVMQAERLHSAFVFIKPHAVTDPVKKLVVERFEKEGIFVRSEGRIMSEKIDKDMLIDTHYGAIASRAMRQKPSELVVQKKAQDAFEKAFGLSWNDAVAKGLVYNLVDGAAKLGCDLNQLGNKYDKLKRDETLVKFGGGFYCGKVDGIYVINGFYARMRSQFTKPGDCIYYYEVEWSPDRLSWADFRGNILGATDPTVSGETSLRHIIYKQWRDLSLTAEPNTGNNGLHASASPFEALAERTNWLGVSIQTDFYGKAMLALGIPASTISAWFQDPAVPFKGKTQSLFDLLEDLDSAACLKKSVEINSGK